MNGQNIYCIVVTYNGAKWIDRCLGSLTSSFLPLTILVIDNASNDGTVEIIKNRFPAVCLLETGANLGFGQANNIGLKKALEENADYVFLLNQDAWIEKNCIKNLIDVASENIVYGLISPLQLNGDGSELEYKFIEYIQPDECPGLVSDKFLSKVKPVYETSFVNAAAWLISKKCLQTVGLFDPIFPHYGEDVDYIQRVQYHRYKAGICPSAYINHDSRIQTWGEIIWNKNRMLTIYISEIKNINGSLRSNILTFFKRRFDELTSNLLYGQFRLLAFRVVLLLKISVKLADIRKARRASKKLFIKTKQES